MPELPGADSHSTGAGQNGPVQPRVREDLGDIRAARQRVCAADSEGEEKEKRNDGDPGDK